jgi:hypothetical protein
VEADERQPTSLHPYVNTMDQALSKAGRLVDSLQHRSLLAPVRAEGLDDACDLITEFWSRFRPIVGTPRNELVVVFIVPPDIELPDAITWLPEPSIHDGHVVAWAERVARAMGWPRSSPRVARLAKAICARVWAEEESLRLYTLYRELEDRLGHLQHDPAAAIAALDAAG